MNKIILLIVVIGLAIVGGRIFGDYLAERASFPMPVMRQRAGTIKANIASGNSTFDVSRGSNFVSAQEPATKFQHKHQESANSLAELKSWLERDPNAALAWYASGGWQLLGDNFSTIKARLAELSASIKENRSAKAYGRRLAWTSIPGQNFELVDEWRNGNGTQLASKIESSPSGIDMMWMVAICNPANDWCATAEWAAGLQVDDTERAAVVEQLARESVKMGEGALAAREFADHDNPLYDRAKAALVIDLAQSDFRSAKIAWDSLTTPAAKLATALQILSNPDADVTAKSSVALWAQKSGASQLAGSLWDYAAP